MLEWTERVMRMKTTPDAEAMIDAATATRCLVGEVARRLGCGYFEANRHLAARGVAANPGELFAHYIGYGHLDLAEDLCLRAEDALDAIKAVR